jgi:HEAT repeat protein
LVNQLKHGDNRKRRQAALALAGAAEETLPDLIEALNDGDPYVREGAARALEAGGSAAVRVLIVALRHEKGLGLIETPMTPRRIPPLKDVLGEEDVRMAIVEIGLPAAPALMDPLLHGTPSVRALAAATLQNIQSGEGGLQQKIAEAVSSENDDVRIAGAVALADNAQPKDVSELSDLLKDTNHYVRALAIRGLGKTGAPAAVAPLDETLHSEQDSKMRYVVVQALGDLSSKVKEAVTPVVELLNDETPFMRLVAIDTLGKMGASAKPGVPALIERLKDPYTDCRAYAAIALGEIGDQIAIAPLRSALHDQESKVREAASEALKKLKDTQQTT